MKTYSCPITRGRVGRGGHVLPQWLKGPALPKSRWAKTVQGECGIGNGNSRINFGGPY